MMEIFLAKLIQYKNIDDYFYTKNRTTCELTLNPQVVRKGGNDEI